MKSSPERYSTVVLSKTNTVRNLKSKKSNKSGNEKTKPCFERQSHINFLNLSLKFRQYDGVNNYKSKKAKIPSLISKNLNYTVSVILESPVRVI